MTRTSTHRLGTPIWVDVMVRTLEQRAQLMSFYTAVFGWAWDVGSEEIGFYSLAQHRGQPVFGLGVNPSGDGSSVTYFSTEDMATSVTKVEQLGGDVVFGPTQVMELGWTAYVTDSVGAVHGLWQPMSFPGFGVAYKPGAPGWFDHVSDDPARAAAYYAGLLGHEVFEPEAGMRILRADEQWFASISYDQVGSRSAQWSPIYIVESLATGRETVRGLGATVVLEEMPVPGSAISVFVEPVMATAVTVMAAGGEPG